MRSPMVDSSRVLIGAVAVLALSIGACIIGPKQDDPSPGAPSFTADSGTAMDTAVADPNGDSAEVPTTETGGEKTDAPTPMDSSAPDTASDAADAADASDATSDDAADAVSDAAEGG